VTGPDGTGTMGRQAEPIGPYTPEGEHERDGWPAKPGRQVPSTVAPSDAVGHVALPEVALAQAVGVGVDVAVAVCVDEAVADWV